MPELTISEKDFQSQIIDAAHLLGYRVAHFRAAQTKYGWRTPVSADGAGFPDMVLARRGTIDTEYGRLIFVEVKGAKGKLSEAQREWNSMLVHTNAEVYHWQVGKIELEEIVEILR